MKIRQKGCAQLTHAEIVDASGPGFNFGPTLGYRETPENVENRDWYEDEDGDPVHHSEDALTYLSPADARGWELVIADDDERRTLRDMGYPFA